MENEIEDIITTKLPVALVNHIVSCLPTKDAVRTSVLSKRWINEWMHVNKLYIDDSVFYSLKKPGWKQHFINFVNRVLLLLSNCPIVESISIVLGNEYDVSILNTWITHILIRGVKNLHMMSDYKIPFSTLTSNILFYTNRLEVLSLEMHCCSIKLPSTTVIFNCLKILKLSGVSFIFGSLGCTPRLFLPVLQKFETKDCNWICAKAVIIQAPLLESVQIERGRMTLSDVVQDPLSCRVLNFASHLKKKFTYCSYGVSQSLFLEDTSSAVRSAVNHVLSNHNAAGRLFAFLFLKQFSLVKCIKFDGFETLSQSCVCALPVFPMLSHLELRFVSCESLLSLLQKSPVLKTLQFEGISTIFAKELLDSAVVPSCFKSTLEVVKFERVNGYEHELCLAKFFMEKSMVLKSISFFLNRPADSEVMKEFKENLHSFKKGSSSAIVEFSMYMTVRRSCNFSEFMECTS